MRDESGSSQILFYFDDCAGGPSADALLALIGQLDGKKFPFRVLLPSSEGPVALALGTRGIEFDVLALPARIGNDGTRGFRKSLLAAAEVLSYLRKLFRYFRMFDFGVVHTDGMRAHLLSIGLKIRFNIPLVWSLWSIVPSGWRVRAFTSLAAVFSDHLVASSMYVAHQLGRSLRWRRRMDVLYRGYDASCFKVARIAPAQPLLGFLASGRSDTAHRVFLRAFELVSRELPDSSAVVLVDDSAVTMLDEMNDLARSMQIETAVSIERYRAADPNTGLAPELTRRGVTVYINPSVEISAFNNDVVEAMGAGVPVVVARIGVLAELVIGETTGMLAKPGDSNSLAEAILKLLKDPVLQNHLAENARHEFHARFALENYVAAMHRIYAKYLSTEAANDEEIEQPEKKAA